MKRKTTGFASLLCVLLIVGCKTASKDAVEIKFKLPKGSKFQYSTHVVMDMNEKVMNRAVTASNDIDLSFLFEEVSDSAGWKKVSSTITGFTMDVNAAGNHMSFGTDNADTTGPLGAASKVFSAMKGSQFFFTVNDDGQVGEVTGVKEMIERILATAPNSDQAREAMTTGVNDQALRQNMQQAFAAYPGKPVKVGDTWSKTLTQDAQGMTVNMNNKYTLVSVTGNDAVIKVESTLTAPQGSMVNGAQVKMDGTSDGDMHYDLATGIQTGGTLNMKMNMKVSTQGMELPIDMTIKTTTKGKPM